MGGLGWANSLLHVALSPRADVPLFPFCCFSRLLQQLLPPPRQQQKREREDEEREGHILHARPVRCINRVTHPAVCLVMRQALQSLEPLPILPLHTANGSHSSSSNGTGKHTYAHSATAYYERQAKNTPLRRLNRALLLSLSRCLDFLPSLVELFFRLLGPVLVLIAWALIFANAYLYFLHILPLHQYSFWTYPGNAITWLGLFILFMIYYCHFGATFVKPGGITKEWVSGQKQREGENVDVLILSLSFFLSAQSTPPNISDLIASERAARAASPHSREELGFTKYCHRCIVVKPRRTHHCQICKTLVLRAHNLFSVPCSVLTCFSSPLLL